MNLKGERGAALVLTLLMITLLLLFVTLLSGQVIQTTKQVTTTEKRIDAELVSQMGIDYVQSVLDTYEYNEVQDVMDYLSTKLDEYLQISKTGNPILILDEARQFEIELPDPLPEVIEGEDLEVTYISIGRSMGQTIETNDTITITFERDE
ncbi:type II secretory pathway, component PulK [Oceanobacillus picturae]|uniref:Type II secretory pathway, component PulK n=2 Tax=Oceanobacillus picturae TaxID=171693 RepID=A0A0U9H9P3_9BACI|nr:type II secretory pathway, component PulK [Oceanobacillus picturae]